MKTKTDKDYIIFLDFDGVLNCQVWYSSMTKEVTLTKMGTQNDIDPWRVSLLNTLCEETGASVVISSSWKHSGLEYCEKALRDAGATFTILGITPTLKDFSIARGCEIDQWIKDNRDYKFKKYAIIDDDSDMLLKQQYHFFQTDGYSGLTPNICYRIKNLFQPT